MKQLALLAVFAWIGCSTAVSSETSTSPITLVDVRVADSPNPGHIRITGVRLFYETNEAAFHIDDDRKRLDMSNRTQSVTVLQSEVKGIDSAFYSFRLVGGGDFTPSEVKPLIAKRPVLLLLPSGATIHPDLASILDADAVIAIRTDSRHSPQPLVPRPAQR
jgi:hypothetical protein